MKNLPLLLGTIVGTVILIVVVALAFSRSSAPVAVDQAQLVAETSPKTGAAAPKVTVVVFSDFQCPACAAAAPLAESLVQQYPDQVQLVYRFFPLTSIHPNALTAAQAALAAGDQGSFWPMHDLLFARQSEWSNLAGPDLSEQLGEYAQELQIDKALFLETIQSDHIKQVITSDLAVAQSLQLNSTPTFFVNGQKTAAPQLRTTVESLLQ